MLTRICPPSTETTLILGPRATGKSTWLRETYPDAKVYDLLDEREALRLARDPRLLGEEVASLPKKQWIVIDEVQRVPALLNEVHRLIERDKRKFMLSGSSARKLRKGDVNLLGGRAEQRTMFPLVSHEAGNAPALDRIQFGMLPRAFLAEKPQKFLNAYATLYLREEIEAEALTRNIGGFARFLEIAARQNGQVTNASNIARDAQIARQTVQGYFDVVVDTLLGRWLPAFKLKRATKLTSHPKFFFFDAGVARVLSGRLPYKPTPEEFGFLFETYLLHELSAYLGYRDLDYPLSYFRTHDAVEVDLLLETQRGHLALEFKSTSEWKNSYMSGFNRIRSELKDVHCIGIYAGTHVRKVDGIEVLPYELFLQRLWADDILR
jgi:uncharacterized protein